MEEVVIALISASVSVVVATLGYVFSKAKEREADWRKKKLEMYHALFDSISGIVRGDSTPESQKVFANSCNTIGLVASASVIEALQDFQTASSSGKNHDEALTNLLYSIRRDLGLPIKSRNLVYKLWASGVKEV